MLVVLSLVMCSQKLLFCSYSDDEKKKKHKRKVRSGSKTEPIVWKTNIENFHNIYAELGRWVDEKAMFCNCNVIVLVKQMYLPRAKREKSRECKSDHAWFCSSSWLVEK